MNMRWLLICVGTFLAIAACFLFTPFSQEIIRVVRLSDAPHFIELSAGEHLRQRLHLSVGTYSGIAFFSNDSVLDGRLMEVTIRGRQGSVVTKGYANTVSYRPSANAMRIEAHFPWLTVDHDDFYEIDISFLSGNPISLRTMPRDTNLPAIHKLKIDEQVYSEILSLNIMKQVAVSSTIKEGLLIGVACALAIALLSLIRNERRKLVAAIILIILFAPLATAGYFISTGDLGIADWDFYVPLHDSYRKAVLEYHTFPFWDPYPCGGTAGLADPEFPFFTITFLLEFLFGVSFGVKLAIATSVAVGGIGMLMLSKLLGRSTIAGLIAAFTVAFGTVNLLEITEGHVNVLAAMWIPWIFWAWLGAYRGSMRPIWCGIFLALTFYAGGIYLLMYTAIGFIALLFFVRNFSKAFFVHIYALVWALGFAALKLIPVLFWLKQFPDDAYTASTRTLPWIVDIFFGRHLHGAYIIFDQVSGWHEYGAYIGYIVFALALIGAMAWRRNRIVQTLIVASIFAVVLSTLGHQLQPLFDVLWFFPRSNISRFILFAVIPIALLASYGVDRITARMPIRFRSALPVLLAGFIAMDIISLAYQVSQQAFVLPHVVSQISPAPSPLAFTPLRYDDAGDGSRTTRSADAYFAGYGTMVYCSVIGPKTAVTTIFDEGGSRIVAALNPRANINLISWNYNTVRVHVDTDESTLVVLNTNYANGWVVNGTPAEIVSNRVATTVSKGSHDITFHYKAPGFLEGLLITVLTAFVGLLSLVPSKKFLYGRFFSYKV